MVKATVITIVIYYCNTFIVQATEYVSKKFLVKNYKIAYNSTTTEARRKISRDMGSLEICTFFDVGFIQNGFWIPFTSLHILLLLFCYLSF
jgi:hypothetical protein